MDGIGRLEKTGTVDGTGKVAQLIFSVPLPSFESLHSTFMHFFIHNSLLTLVSAVSSMMWATTIRQCSRPSARRMTSPTLLHPSNVSNPSIYFVVGLALALLFSTIPSKQFFLGFVLLALTKCTLIAFFL